MFLIVIFCFTPYIAVVLPMLLLVIVSCLLYAYLQSFEIKRNQTMRENFGRAAVESPQGVLRLECCEASICKQNQDNGYILTIIVVNSHSLIPTLRLVNQCNIM